MRSWIRREIKPYKALIGTQRSLDNGGRFYNVFTRSGDDLVDPAELAKAAGVHSVGIKAFLHFEMAMMDLPPEQKDKIVARLFLSLLEKYKAQRPATLRPSSVESQGQSGKATIVFGYSHNGDRHRTGYITLRWRFTRFRSLLKELYFEDKTS